MNTHKNMLNNKKEMIYHTHMYTCKLVSTTKSLGTIELKPGHLNQIIEQNISIKIPNIIKISTSIHCPVFDTFTRKIENRGEDGSSTLNWIERSIIYNRSAGMLQLLLKYNQF